MNYFIRTQVRTFETDTKYTFTNQIIQLPLLLKINFSSFCIYAGVSYNYFGKAEVKMDGKSVYETDIKKWELSYPMGLAFFLGNFIFDLRYDYGSKFLGKDSHESIRSDLFVLFGYRF